MSKDASIFKPEQNTNNLFSESAMNAGEIDVVHDLVAGGSQYLCIPVPHNCPCSSYFTSNNAKNP
ncbi:MAG: hypothetical protein GX550_03335 [Syntrophomonadaceae bacterium]|nr:hypothetical protein [Syntrophomonadaceae bacterium]